MLSPSPWPWVLAALALAHQHVAAELPSNAIELDLVFPRADGVYAKTEIGLPVLVSLQNPNAAYHYGWSIEWPVSHTTSETPRFWNMGYFGAALKNDTKFDGNTTFLSDEIGKLAAGEYRFTYDVRMGIWCAFRPGEVEYSASPRLNKGNFTFTVAADAPTPTFTGTCPSAIGSVSFSELTTFHGLMPSLDPQPETTSSCAGTASITHEVQPCAATAGEAQEMSLSSRMQWGESYATGGAAPSQTGAAASVGPLLGIGAMGLVGVMAGLA
ncbi:hypothetical protein HYQ45_011933 [Verticillium longisporum]|uniref:DUF7136 domain-containing protein n=1 Tax=Verticillium longisporum TaxID=100787 RepID=A0A8I2ZGW6_VERLO|nr:hypothetical protein HYQ44_004764 [Verticillium longisporum]KAG7128452.1 hypothetical protein HYQ45_011933 [Verticillium longisporum]